MATTAGSRPDFSSSSTMARCSRDTEPWCAGRDRLDAPGAAARAGLAISCGRRSCPVGQRLAGRPLVGQLVEPGGQPLGQPAGVGEHDRRPVRLDQVEHPLLDRRPDRGPRLGRRRPTPRARRSAGRARLMSSTGTTTERSHCLRRRRRDDRHRPAAGQEAWRPPRSAARSPTARSAGPGGRAARPAARGDSARWAPRLVRRPRAPRRRSPSRRRAAPPGRRWSAAGTATRGW